MDVVGSKNVEITISCLVSYAIPNFGPNHHLDAVHVVVHDIVKRYFQSLFVDNEEVDFLLCADLEPYISPHEVNKASNFKSFLNYPLPFLGVLIFSVFENSDIARGPSYEKLIEHQIHLP